MNPAFGLVVAGSLFAVGVIVLRAGYGRSMQANQMVLRLQFPKDLSADDVGPFIESLSGLLYPWWKRWIVQPVIGFEAISDDQRIQHRLIIPQVVYPFVTSALQAHLPSVRYEVVKVDPISVDLAIEMTISTNQRALRVDPVAMSHGLLSAMQPLEKGESTIIQWLLTPSGPTKPVRLLSRGDKSAQSFTAQLLTNSEAVSALNAKQSAPLFSAVTRLGVSAPTKARSIQLLRRLESPWHASRAPGVHLKRRLGSSRSNGERLMRRASPTGRWSMSLNSQEICGLVGWPVGVSQLPGLELGGCRLLPVAGAIERFGTELGLSTYPGTLSRIVALDDQARRRHVHLIGPTGVGKSTLMAQMILSDADAGHAVIVLDPKGDLVTTIAERLPEHRLKDAIVLDPTDERAVGFNPLACTPDSRELVVEQIVSTMHSIWKAFWGPRSDEIIRAACLSLTAAGDMTLVEISSLLTDQAFRRRILSTQSDPFGTEAFWTQYEAWSGAERTAAIAAPLNKVRAMTTMRSRLRGVLGQPNGAVNLDRIIRDRRILLVNLAAGRLGDEAAHLIGTLLFSSVWNAVSARAGTTGSRPFVALHADEFQHFVALDTSAEVVFSEARAYGLGVVAAHQHLGQLSKYLAETVRANCKSRVVFQSARSDAAIWSRELGGGLTPEDLMGISAFEAVASCFAAGSVQPPATIATVALPPAIRQASVVFERSRQTWGVDRADVDAAIKQRREGPTTPPKPVGRSRRGQA